MKKSTLVLRKTLIFIVLLVVFVIFVAAIPVVIYLNNFSSRELSPNPEQWGQLGDYVGGLINPILGFATLISVLYAIFLQRTELGDAKDALANQSALMDEQIFDGKFFNMLSLFNESVNSMRLTIDGKEYFGYEAIEECLHEFIIKSCDMARGYKSSDPHHSISDIVGILAGYKNYYLGSATMFMTIERILAIENAIADNPIADKQHYHGLFTVFLSYEMKIWMYIFYFFTKKEAKISADYGNMGDFLQYCDKSLAARLDIDPTDLKIFTVAVQKMVSQ